MDNYRPILGVANSSDEDDFYNDWNNHTRKRRNARTKDEQILGIWADSSDTCSDKESHMDAASSASIVLKPTEFVVASDNTTGVSNYDPALKFGASPNDSGQSGVVGSFSGVSKDQDDSLVDPPLESGSDSDTDSSSESDGADSSSQEYSDSSSTDQNVRQHRNKANVTCARPKNPVQQNVSKEFGKFTNSTVWNMMAKMGYKVGEGLGKHGEGRIEPVQVVTRRSGEGISYSRSERPSEPYRHVAKSEKDTFRRGKGIELGGPRGADTSLEATTRTAPNYTKVEYKTLEQLQKRTDAKVNEVFIDMATNTQVGSLAELVSQKLPLSEKEQLTRDVQLGLDLAFNKLEQIKREKTIEGNRSSVLYKDIDSLSSSIDRRRGRIEYLSKVKYAIEDVYDKAKDTTITSMDEAMNDMKGLYCSFHSLYDVARRIEDGGCGFDVWRELKLEQVVTGVMFDQLKCILDKWTPAEHMHILADILTALRMYMSTNDNNLQAEDMTPFESLLNITLVPRLKRFIFTEWDPLSDSLGSVLDALPQTTIFSISNDIGFVLQRFVSGINTRAVMNEYNNLPTENGVSFSAQTALSPLRVDHVIIPWLPFVSEQSELLSSIRHKLCAVLDLWVPSRQTNKDIVGLVSPWMQVLQGKDRYKLCIKVARRLEHMLKSEFRFDAQKQTTWPFKVLIEWHGVLPLEEWFSVAEKGIISRFLDYLWTWLQQPNTNYAEIADWYWQWKRMYPDEIFAHPVVQNEFKKALVYMAHAMTLS
ncbi:hypothetical protein IW140_005433 [Coemansia sp. RSA 1813]|nr:hypothetical protein LPJ74_004529 [Coemansia sp. RSA 1843]KAJ2086925.1 hypothetical protein IW138_005340 [Coemansia sp. RSA 986]KAJ2211625.1 hypothetical protein EV179_005347 [Coemansia sp. RSA 487]KAJ2565175.1 hypothetical protein IW140_005433 [Coemansia sp. RSA 1813]